MCNKCNLNNCTCNHYSVCSHDQHCSCDSCMRIPRKEFYRTNMWNDYQNPHIQDCKPHECDSCVDFYDSNCVVYTQDDLECTGIKKEESLSSALKKIDGLQCTILDEISGLPQDVIINNIPGLSFNKVVVGSVIHFTPVIDYYYLASIICAICEDDTFCAPINSYDITEITATTFNVNIGTTMGPGETFDVSVDNGVTYILSGQTANSVTVTGLIPLTEYTIVLRHHCANGGTSVSQSYTITTDSNPACPSITSITKTYGTYDIVNNTYPVTLTWGSVSGATGYEIFLTGTGSLGTTTAPTFTFNLPAGTVYSGYIQTNCSLNSSNNPFNGTVPAAATCPNPTSLVVTLS